MAWTDRDEEEIEESAAGSGARGKTFTATPGEKVQFDFERTDAAGNNEPWLACVDASVDAAVSGWTSPHLRVRRLQASHKRPTITMSGHYSYSAWIENDDPTPLDKVKAKIHVKKDGVSI
jgi:hypothetical protein